MSKGKVNRVGMIAVFSLLAVAVLWQAKLYLAHENEKPHHRKIVSTSSRKSPAKAKRARLEYFQRMLRDPATGQIPRGIRQGELEFAARLKGLAKAQGSAGLDTMFTWKEAGPTDVGGRTRALAIDVTNSQVVIVGGVSGGLWKSTDGGATWVLKSDPNQVLSITSIAQDTRTGSTDIWYAVTGEFRGSTFDNVNAGSSYFGAGIYKSTDGGDNWVLIQSAADPSSWDTKFDMVMRVVVSPTTGDVFIATNNYGVYRSTDGGATFTGVLGNTPNDHSYSDVAVDADGYVYAVINYSPVSTAAPQQAAGVYISDDGGANWDVITPTGYPVRQERSVLALPASNVNALYLMTYTGDILAEDVDDVKLYKFDLINGTSVDLSDNLSTTPINTQASYNMTLAVKPDDENTVIIGGVDLYRSIDGFATAPDAAFAKIGGASTPNHHADQHAIVFVPGSPNIMFSGHDGGITMTPDITAATGSFAWTDLNSGYNVTQFYTVTLADEAGDQRIIGGAQDNGTPYFLWDGTSTGGSVDASSGDGAFAYLGDAFYYSSAQNGDVLRMGYTAGGVNDLVGYLDNTTRSDIKPTDAVGALFINPFVVDPNDEEVMYYPAGTSLWRNTALSTIPDGEVGTMVGWENVAGLAAPAGYIITALQVSISNPVHVLYYGASGADVPVIYRLASSTTATSGAADISIPGAGVGSYVANIAVHPENADEIVVVLSNYNVAGLYHSNNGGQTYTDIEGNLASTDNVPGPSMRWLSMLPMPMGGTAYLLGTSIGLFGTMSLDGANTQWDNLSEIIGNVVVSSVASRVSDHRVLAGTHGRGIFVGEVVDLTQAVADAGGGLPTRATLHQNYPNPFNPATSIDFDLPVSMTVELVVYNLQGRVVASLVDGRLTGGSHSVKWQGRDATGRPVATGTYIARLVTPESTRSIKMVLLK